MKVIKGGKFHQWELIRKHFPNLTLKQLNEMLENKIKQINDEQNGQNTPT